MTPVQAKTKGKKVTEQAEALYWLVLMHSAQVDRKRAKEALYRWAVEQQQGVKELAGLSAAALQERLPELDAAQATAWQRALDSAEEASLLLATWREQGVHLLTRAEAAYPENWVARLSESWLPYILFYRGNIELLAEPAIWLAGAEAPDEATRQAAEEAATRLGPRAFVLAGGFGKGIDRQALTAGSQALGRTILILPLGFAHAGPILRAGQTAVEQGRRLELSPYAPDAAYSPTLGHARSLLVTALAEALALFEPDSGPDDWPGYEAFTQHGGLALIWERGRAKSLAPWQAAGAQPFGDTQALEAALTEHLLLEVEEITLAENNAEGPEAEPIRFGDAASAIRRLSETGHVPDKLARRLREAEEQGWLGEGQPPIEDQG